LLPRVEAKQGGRLCVMRMVQETGRHAGVLNSNRLYSWRMRASASVGNARETPQNQSHQHKLPKT
jgi:hypothetical protein